MFSGQNLDAMSAKAGGAKTAFINLATQGLKLTQTDAQDLWDTFVQQQLDMLAAKAGTTRSSFINLAGQLGITKSAAGQLWTSFQTGGVAALNAAGAAAGNLNTKSLAPLGVGVDTVSGKVQNLSKYLLAVPKAINSQVTVAGSGTGGINLVPTPSGLPSGNVRFTTLASGGLISQGTGPTADDVLALVSKGETVVSAADSKKLAPYFKALGVPGYAAGGTYKGMTGSNLPQVPGVISGVASADAGDIEVMFAKALVALDQAAFNKMAAAAAAKAAAAISTGGSIPVGVASPGGAGDYSVAQLEALWIQAGGPASAAYNMAEIALAESAGNPDAYNASGATGLWQILGQVSPGNLDNPLVNSQNAVAKFDASGYAPWAADPVGAALSGLSGGGRILGYDQGGKLPTGLSMAWNGTGKPEPVGGGTQKIEVTISWDASMAKAGLTADMIRNIKHAVRVHGGGSTQKAFGKPGIKA